MIARSARWISTSTRGELRVVPVAADAPARRTDDGRRTSDGEARVRVRAHVGQSVLLKLRKVERRMNHAWLINAAY